MKTAKTFRLSDEAVAVLEKQENATQYLEELILKHSEPISRGEAMILDRLERILRGKNEYGQITGEEVHVPPVEILGGTTVIPPSPVEQSILDSLPVTPACCLLKTPCRHWSWSSEKMAYVNSISGEIKEPMV